MPLHDFACRQCGAVQLDVYRPIAERASDRPPLCYGNPNTGAHDPVVTEWLPQVGAMDAAGTFTPFSVEVQGRNGVHQTRTVDSLHTLRTIERETEQAHRNGEGQPMRFRMWSNDRSNGDVNSFGADPATVATAALAKEREEVRSRAAFGMSKGAQVTAVHGEAKE